MRQRVYWQLVSKAGRLLAGVRCGGSVEKETMKQWRLAWIAVVLLVSPLVAEPADFPTAALRTVAGADFAVCRYPSNQSRLGLDINGHDFWVHRPNVIRDGEGKAVFIQGQISHRLAYQFDDQIYYAIPFQDGKPQKAEISVDAGGIGAFFDILPLEVISSLKVKIGDWEVGLAPDKLAEAAAEIQRYALGRGWEGQAGALIAQIAITAAVPNYCAQFYYTAEVSEEGPSTSAWCGAPRDGTNNWALEVGAIGFRCRGSYCDNVSLACARVPEWTWLDYTTQHETGYFSEEQGTRSCNGGIVVAVGCQGRYCDNINLVCVQPGWGKVTNCRQSPQLSEEDGGLFNFGRGNFITGGTCKGRYCDNKEFTVCSIEKPEFTDPTFLGYRLDFCREWGANCGEPAADAFCVSKGYTRSIGWVIDEDIDAETPTKIITDPESICSGSDCDGFKVIWCEN